MRHGRASRGAAQECSPRRESWVDGIAGARAPEGRKKLLPPLRGLSSVVSRSPGSRPGLHSAAAPRLNRRAELPDSLVRGCAKRPRLSDGTRRLDRLALLALL